MSFLYHLVPIETWHKCKEQHQAYYPPTYQQDGFIHLTKDPAFLLGVANNFYLAKEPWEWVCLRIDPSLLTSEVEFEPAAPVGNTAPPASWGKDDADEKPAQPLFPHLYGTIDFPAVLQEHAVLRDAETGRFLSIHDVAA